VMYDKPFAAFELFGDLRQEPGEFRIFGCFLVWYGI